MTSKTTGDHDVVVELSETVLSAMIAEQLVGVRRFGATIVRIAAASVTALAPVDGQARVEIRAKIIHGTARSNAPSLTLRGLRLTLRIRAPIAIEVSETGAPSIRVELKGTTSADVTTDWEPGTLTQLCQQAAAQGVTVTEGLLEMLAVTMLTEALKAQTLPPVAIPGVKVDPACDAMSTVSPMTVRRMEVTSRAREGSSPSVIALVATMLAAHGDGAAAKKTRTGLGFADGLAVGLSPDAVRDGIVCPALAKFFRSTTSGLCPACGGGTVSLKDRWSIPVFSRLDMTRIDLAFNTGEVVVTCAVDGAGPAFTLHGSITLHVTFALVSGALEVRATLDTPSLSIDTNDVLDVFSLGATQALASLAAELARNLAKSFFDAAFGDKPVATVALPAAPGANAVYDAVWVDEDGVLLFAKVPVVAKTLAPVSVSLDVSMTQRLTVVRTGSDGATCLKSGYAYSDCDAEQTFTARVSAKGLAPIVDAAWNVAGQPVPREGGELALAASNTGEGADAQDGAVRVFVAVDASQWAFTLRNVTTDGNFLLGLSCQVDDGVDVYGAYATLSVDGQPRLWDAQYGRDTLECARRTVSLDPQIRWPASDGPEGAFPGGVLRGIPRIHIGLGGGRDPSDSPWAQHPVASMWFHTEGDSVVRSAAGEALLKLVAAPGDLASLRDPAAFRTAPRVVPVAVERVDVTPVAAPIAARVTSPAAHAAFVSPAFARVRPR